jgi:hypothetical protein
MAHTMTNRGLFYLENNAITSSTDIRQAAFIGSAPSVATIRDLNFLADLTALQTEATFTNYARQDLAGVTITESDASDNVVISATAATISSAGGASNQTVTTVAYYVEGASDAARTLLSVDVPSSSITTNGSNLTLPTLTYTTTGS